MIIDYDVWATSASTGREEWPAIPRSALNEKEASDQAEEFIKELRISTGVTDWVPHWKHVEGER